MGDSFYTCEFQSTLKEMGKVLPCALECLEKNGWITAEQSFYARLCLEEALINAITHGNGRDPERKVLIEMFDEGECCRIRVIDEGQGFELAAVPKRAVDDLGGRGLLLIKSFMKDVCYDQEERCLYMILPKKGLGKGGETNE